LAAKSAVSLFAEPFRSNVFCCDGSSSTLSGDSTVAGSTSVHNFLSSDSFFLFSLLSLLAVSALDNSQACFKKSIFYLKKYKLCNTGGTCISLLEVKLPNDPPIVPIHSSILQQVMLPDSIKLCTDAIYGHYSVTCFKNELCIETIGVDH
jgi:hypothetical protein